MAMRDGDKVVVSVVSEGDGELVIQTQEGKEETYYLNPIRSMRLIVEELQVSCGASALSLGMPGRLPPPQFSVRGTAWLEGGHISVIGEPANKSRTLSISFKAYDEADIANREAELGKMPHTVSLGFVRRDWEIGNDDEWFVECYVAPAMMDAIAAAISGRTLKRMTVSLTLDGIYSDDNWAPPSAGADWFLRPSRSDNSLQFPEMVHGGIMVLDLGLARADLRAKLEPEPGEPDLDDLEQTHADALIPAEQLQAIQALASNIEKFRGTVKTVGWAIAAVLLVLALK